VVRSIKRFFFNPRFRFPKKQTIFVRKISRGKYQNKFRTSSQGWVGEKNIKTGGGKICSGEKIFFFI